MKNVFILLLFLYTSSIFSQDLPEYLNVYIEDKDFTAGENINVEIWSDDIEDLAACQFSLTINNAEFFGSDESEDFLYTIFSFTNEDTLMKALGFINSSDPEINSIDLENNESWLTMENTIKCP